MNRMGPDDIRQLAAWLAETDIDSLELRGPEQALRLRHEGADVEVLEGANTPAPFDAAVSAAANALTVDAPSLGVFLHRHPLRHDDLLLPGATVRAGQVLGLLQTGPLLLSVVAPTDGVVLEVLAAHGSVVGFATPLASLLPSSAN